TPTIDVGGAGPGADFLCGGGGADDAGGRVLRPAADLGCDKRERGLKRERGFRWLNRIIQFLPFPSRGRSRRSRRGSPWFGSSRLWRRRSACGSACPGF